MRACADDQQLAIGDGSGLDGQIHAFIRFKGRDEQEGIGAGFACLWIRWDEEVGAHGWVDDGGVALVVLFDLLGGVGRVGDEVGDGIGAGEVPFAECGRGGAESEGAESAFESWGGVGGGL